MKKYLIFFPLLISLIGIIFFNYNDSDRIPTNGIYFIKQNSTYAYNKGEDIYIYLDFYKVSTENENNTLVGDVFGSIELMSEDLEATILKVDDELVLEDTFSYKGKNVYRYSFGIQIKEDNLEISTVKFTTKTNSDIALTDNRTIQDKETIIQDINLIEIRTLDKCDYDVCAYSNKIVWESYYLPTITHEVASIDNKCNDFVVVKNFDYGLAEITFPDREEVEIGSNKESVIDWAARLSYKENKDEPIVYYLKPILIIEKCGEELCIPFGNVSKESYYGEKEMTGEYLYRYGKK